MLEADFGKNEKRSALRWVLMRDGDETERGKRRREKGGDDG